MRKTIALSIIVLLALAACSGGERAGAERDLVERYGQYCGDAVDEVYDCGDYLKGQRNTLGGGSRWWDAATGDFLDCPVVAPDSIGPGCKALMERQATMTCVKVLDCPEETDDGGDEGTRLENPASRHCVEKGGVLAIRDAPDGQIGVCLLDGRECEEWALFRGEGCVAPIMDLCGFCCSEDADARCAAATCDCDARFVACPAARTAGPVACTMEYAPVCGKLLLNSGEERFETFGNACVACAAMTVVGYTPGECEVAR